MINRSGAVLASAVLAAGLLGVAGLQAAAEQEPNGSNRVRQPVRVTSDAVRWQTGPRSLPSGAQIAVLEGDLARAEPYTFRLKLPDGYRVPPHSHPVDEHVTVLQGTLMMGMGSRFDREAAEPLPPGSLFILPRGNRHYVWTEGETIVQLHGVGPWGIDYVDPADDPRNR